MFQSSAHPVVSSAPPARPRRWGRAVLLALLSVLEVGLVGVLFGLDPWLRRQLQQQVATASHGRYELRIRQLRTHLWARTLTLQGVQLRTLASPAADTAALPDLRLDLGELRVAGVGLGAVLRRQIVPIDSVVLNSVQLRLAALPRSSGPRPPLYQQLPLGLPGLRLGYLGLHDGRVRYGTVQRATAQLSHAALQAYDVLLSAAGAADTTRFGYARRVSGEVQGVLARAPGHVVRIGQGRFSTAAGQLTLDSVRVAPLQAISSQRTSDARVALLLPRLQLRGLAAGALARGRFRADSLLLLAPKLALTLPAVSPPPPHKLLAAYFRSIRLGQLRISGGQLRVLGQERRPELRDIQLTGSDLRLTAAAYGQPKYLYYARAWQLRTGRGRLRLDAPYYQATFGSLQADTRAGRLAVTEVAVTPTMPVAEVARRKGHQSAHVTLRLASAEAQGLNLAALLRQGQVLARTVALRRVRVLTASDGRFPINPKQSVVTPETIGRLPFRVDVRQLRLLGGEVHLSYRAPRSAQVGALVIRQLTATLRNLSNDPRRMSATQPLMGEATGRFQRQSLARFRLRANLLDPAGRHTVVGSFTGTPLAVLNPMVEPTRGIRFRSGTIRHIRFEMQLDRSRAQGTMWAEYDDLKLDLLNRQNRRDLLRRVGTTLANGLFLRDNNPRRPGQALKPGRMTSGRELRYSVFSLWRQGLVSGLLNSAGVPAPLAKKLSEGE